MRFLGASVMEWGCTMQEVLLQVNDCEKNVQDIYSMAGLSSVTGKLGIFVPYSPKDATLIFVLFS
jgi:hypothetical protein